MSFDEAPSSPSSSLGINSFRASLKTFSDALFDLEEAHVAVHTAEGAADICNGYAEEAKEWVNWLKDGQVEWRVSMSKCDRCGIEVGNLYCGNCREIIRRNEIPAVPSDELIILLAYDKKTDLYRYGCSVKECPCNLQNGWCSKATPSFFVDRIQFMLHSYDGDNCVKQFCG